MPLATVYLGLGNELESPVIEIRELLLMIRLEGKVI
jgi:hypothetical protein